MQAGWQVRVVRHLALTYEDRDDAYTLLQGALDLDAHEVIGVVDAHLAITRPLRVARIVPVIANDGQQHGTLTNALTDVYGEVQTRRNGLHVVEDIGSFEAILQPLEDSVGGVTAVIAAVADEDLAASRW